MIVNIFEKTPKTIQSSVPPIGLVLRTENMEEPQRRESRNIHDLENIVIVEILFVKFSNISVKCSIRIVLSCLVLSLV